MQFQYKAKKSINETVDGRVEANSLEEAIEQLARLGIVPVSVEPLTEEVKLKQENIDTNVVGDWNTKRLTVFTQKLYTLTRSGVELLSALRLLQQNTQDPVERKLLEEIIKNIKEGVKLSDCLSRFPKHFPYLYVNIIKTGESTGQLKESLSQLLAYLQRIEDLRSKVRQALAYPIFMVIVGIATIFIMLSFIMPKLVGMFEDFQATLPLPTRMLLATSNIFKKYWLIMLVSLFAGYFLIEQVFGGRAKLLAYLKYRLPVIKKLVHKQALASFATSLSLLLKSGVTLLSALATAAPIIGNPEYISQLEAVRQDIREGTSFSQALAKYKIFPPFFLQMIRVGEEGGRLDNVLADIADSYEKEIEADLKIISSLLEPAIILFLGLIIGGMVIAVLLPIFNINILFAG